MTRDYETLYNERHHEFTPDGIFCPVTKQYVKEAYTDHNIRGVFPDGEERIVEANSCVFCGDPNFSISGALRALNEKRKQEARRKK
jgi:hypothetical protein